MIALRHVQSIKDVFADRTYRQLLDWDTEPRHPRWCSGRLIRYRYPHPARRPARHRVSASSRGTPTISDFSDIVAPPPVTSSEVKCKMFWPFYCKITSLTPSPTARDGSQSHPGIRRQGRQRHGARDAGAPCSGRARRRRRTRAILSVVSSHMNLSSLSAALRSLPLSLSLSHLKVPCSGSRKLVSRLTLSMRRCPCPSHANARTHSAPFAPRVRQTVPPELSA